VTERIATMKDERRALEMLRQGDMQGLEALVKAHQAAAFRLAFSLTRDRQTAEDVVAEAFIAVYTKFHQYDARRDFVPWFHRIVINRCLKELRGRSRVVWCEPATTSSVEDLPDLALSPEQRALQKEESLYVADALERLSIKLRLVIVLRYYGGLDDRAIAQTLGCPYPTVRWRMHEAHKQLRHLLTDADLVSVTLTPKEAR